MIAWLLMHPYAAPLLGGAVGFVGCMALIFLGCFHSDNSDKDGLR